MAASLLASTILRTLVLMMFVVGFTMSGFLNHYQLASASLESLGIVPPGFGVIPAVVSLLGAGITEVGTKKFRRLARSSLQALASVRVFNMPDRKQMVPKHLLG